jgi:hypothetical protein
MSKVVTEAAYGSEEWEAQWERKGNLVRQVLGEGAFDPWARLAVKSERGFDVSVEARYLERFGIEPKSAAGQKMRASYLESQVTQLATAPGRQRERKRVRTVEMRAGSKSELTPS